MLESEFEAMVAHEEHHWWYRGRRRVLDSKLDRLGLPAGARMLDAGCGSGRMLDDLAARGQVTGVDMSRDAVVAARRRGHTDVRRGAIERLPFEDDAFDVITCLDVIEHTPDDRVSLRELRRVARPGGLLVATVPAYPVLWSRHDERNLHFRRYTRRSLRAAAREAGWEVVEDGCFNSLLLPAAALTRLLERLRPPSRSDSDLALTPPILDRLLELPLRLEAWLIARGAHLPMGLSVLAVLRNPGGVVSRAAAWSQTVDHATVLRGAPVRSSEPDAREESRERSAA